VERYDSIKCADSSNMLDRFPDQVWVNGSGGIHAERIEAKFPQTANQAAVTTADVEDSRARRKAAATAASNPSTTGSQPTPKRTRLQGDLG
jgi:hypothetical protein